MKPAIALLLLKFINEKAYLRTEVKTASGSDFATSMTHINSHSPEFGFLTKVLEHLADLFCIYDKNFRLVYANAAAKQALPHYIAALNEGATVGEAIKKSIETEHPHLDQDAIEKVGQDLEKKLKGGEAYELKTFDERVLQVRNERLNNRYIFGLAMDITEIKNQKAQTEKLAKENFQLANTDQLTGLSNRRKFIETLDETIFKHRAVGSSFYVGLIDLNGFKRINDLYGHAIGDALLCSVASRASDFIQDDAFIARLGGDEFALIMQVDQTQLDLLSFSAGLCEILKERQNLAGNDIQISASVGWAAYPKDGKTASDLLRKADFALYKSKDNETGDTVVFSGTDENELSRESSIVRELETANLKNEIILEFQPIFDTRDNSVAGFEALARWENPVLGHISPLVFIPLAEKTGHISRLTKVILTKALQYAIHWPDFIDLHVNISALDLGKVSIINDLIHIIKQSTYPSSSVVFEVTETAVVDTFENMSEIFSLLEENGLRLALDDFGTGFSSLSYLSRIPLTCLKVDKSFMNHLRPDSDEETILKTIIYLCENLNINCVVEGVETEAQQDHLRSLKVNFMQGYHFSPSLSAQNLPAFLLRNITQRARDDMTKPISYTKIMRAS